MKSEQELNSPFPIIKNAVCSYSQQAFFLKRQNQDGLATLIFKKQLSRVLPETSSGTGREAKEFAATGLKGKSRERRYC